MPLALADRVQETTNTTGTGTLTLAGAVAGFQSFSVIGNANTTYYTIVSGSNWEVGIGTYTSAGTLLSRDTVYSSSAAGAKITVAAGARVFVTYPSEKSVYEDSSGNVGIGSIPQAWNADYRALQIGNSGGMFSSVSAASTLGLSANIYYDSVGARYINTGAGSFYTQVNGSHTFSTVASGTAGALTGPLTDLMLIDASGNVRVGASGGLTDKFEVVGNGARSVARASTTAGQSWMEAQVSNYWSGSVFTGTSVNQYGSTATGTTVGLSNANLGSLLFQNGSAGLIYTNGGSPVVFGTNSAERMRIDTSGNVGIGTSTVRAQEHVFGIGQTTAALTDAGARGGMLRVSDNSSAVGAGGAILFANSQGDTANSTGFAAVKGLLADGTTNTIGHLAFSTRATVAATALTERMRITVNGGVSFGATGTAFGTSGQVLQSNGDAPPTWLSGVVTETGTQTLTNKTINLTSNTLSGTKSQFDVALSDDNFAYVGTANTFTATNTFKGVTSTVFTITDAAGFQIDPANGEIQIVTLGANRTPAATNFVNGQCVLLGINDGTAFTITWTTVAVTWVKANGGASAPILATTGFTWVLLWEAGGVIYGTEVGKP